MKQLFLKYKWKAGGWLLNIIIIPILIIHFTASKPELRFYAGNTYSIARTDDKVDSLAVIYRHHNIAKDSMNILWTTIDIENIGGDIKESDYTSEPFGLKVKGCTIIAVRPLDTVNNHLARIIKPRISSSTSMEFNKIAFDSHERVRLLIYMLYKWGHPPTEADFLPVGKITGEKTFATLPQSDEDASTWKDIFLFLKIVGIELLIFLPPIFFYFYLKKSFRKRQISKRLVPNHFRAFNAIENQFVKIYVKLGKKDFLKLLNGFIEGNNYIAKENTIMNAYEIVNETRDTKALGLFSKKITYFSPFSTCYKLLIEADLIKKDGDILIMTSELKDEAQRILNLFSKN